MHYLRGTASYGVHNVGYPRVLEGYIDSTGYIHDANELKATSGYVFTLGGDVVS